MRGSDRMMPEELISILRSAERAAVLTGAGISAESGVPTFREAQSGLWAQYAPEDLATPQAFQRDPRLVWDWYAWRRELVARAAPNPGHYALVELEKRMPWFSLITQNVDGLHDRAGSRSVIELHGNIQRVRCSQDNLEVETWEEETAEGSQDEPPRCPRCRAFLRPDVVWFGEVLPSQALEAAVEAVQRCQVFFSIGTSSIVQPAASLPYLALRRGVPVVEINPHATPLSPEADYVLQGPAGAVLPRLVKAAWHRP